MSCEICREALLIDDVEPPCFSDIPSPLAGEGEGEGEIPGINSCWIPPLDERGQRIYEIYLRLKSLKDLVDPGSILSAYNADLEDIELLSFVAEEMRKMETGKSIPGD